VREKPILMSAPMVRAILEGRKTQTRRIYKRESVIHLVRMESGADACVTDAVCPYGKVGDRLWVRESCWIDGVTDHVHYCATDMPLTPRKTPSIFMPRWASRITLEVVAVRVESLQDISEEDCIAEGIEMLNGCYRDYRSVCAWSTSPKISYMTLWESINRVGSWAANPYVWVIQFRRMPNE